MIKTPTEPGGFQLPDPPPVSFDDVKIDFNVAPWRFKGVEGAVTLNPQVIILIVEGQDVFDERAKKIGSGSRIVFAIPSGGHAVVANVCVMETPEQIEEQIRSRGGWKALP